MRYDDYAGAIDTRAMQQRLESCAAQDDYDGLTYEECAHHSVRDCICPCIASEETICNALDSSISEAMSETGHCR